MKRNGNRMVSSLLAIFTTLSVLLQPFAIYAVEPEPAPYEAEYPELRKVRKKLMEDEVVDAEDHEVETGSDFDISNDFSNLNFSSDKVKITFYEAKNKTGQKFDTRQADTYQAVYFVEPVSGNPS